MNALEGFEARMKKYFYSWDDANEGCPEFDPADESENEYDSCTEEYDPSDEPWCDSIT